MMGCDIHLYAEKKCFSYADKGKVFSKWFSLDKWRELEASCDYERDRFKKRGGELDKKDEELTDLRAKLEAVEKENALYKVGWGEVGQLHDENTVLREQNIALNDKEIQLTRENAALREEVAEKDKAISLLNASLTAAHHDYETADKNWLDANAKLLDSEREVARLEEEKALKWADLQAKLASHEASQWLMRTALTDIRGLHTVCPYCVLTTGEENCETFKLADGALSSTPSKVYEAVKGAREALDNIELCRKSWMGPCQDCTVSFNKALTLLDSILGERGR